MEKILEKPSIDHLLELTKQEINLLHLEPQFAYNPDLVFPEISNTKELSLKSQTLNVLENKIISNKEDRQLLYQKLCDYELPEVKNILTTILKIFKNKTI